MFRVRALARGAGRQPHIAAQTVVQMVDIAEIALGGEFFGQPGDQRTEFAQGVQDRSNGGTKGRAFLTIYHFVSTGPQRGTGLLLDG